MPWQLVSAKLEERFAARFGRKYGVLHANGTATMHSALLAAGVGVGEAQLAPSAMIPTLTGQPITGRRGIRIELDDQSVIREIGQGAQTFVAFYTQKGKPFHVITKVVVRMQAWLGFLTNPAG